MSKSKNINMCHGIFESRPRLKFRGYFIILCLRWFLNFQTLQIQKYIMMKVQIFDLQIIFNVLFFNFL